MTVYTIGIVFTPNFERVLLINKLKPEWQRGKLNFPGGKMEEEDLGSVLYCNNREFKEETNLDIPIDEWKIIGKIVNEDRNYTVHVLTAIYDEKGHGIPTSLTDELIYWDTLEPSPNWISNLAWLVPFAKNVWIQGNADSLNYGVFHYNN